MISVVLAAVWNKIRHAFRIKFRIHAEELSTQAASPFFEHAVMPVGWFCPFTVTAAIGIDPVVFGLFSVYPNVLCVARIKFCQRLQLVYRLVEEFDGVFVVSEVVMRYFERLVVVKRHRRYLEKYILFCEIVVFWSAVEVSQSDFIPRLHETVFYLGDFCCLFDIGIALLRPMPSPSWRPWRKRDRIQPKNVMLMSVHAFIYFAETVAKTE